MSSPLVSIWLEPRKTLQSIVDRDPEYMVFPLAMLGGISQALNKASVRNLGDETSMPLLLGICIGGGIFSGLVGLYLFGFLVRVAGGWIGGHGKAENVRAALAWASVPAVASLVLWIPEYWLFGHDLFSATTPRIDERPFLLLGFSLVEMTLGIWSMVLACKTVGQAHGFSAWRGLSAMIVATLLVLVPIFALAFGLYYLTS